MLPVNTPKFIMYIFVDRLVDREITLGLFYETGRQ